MPLDGKYYSVPQAQIKRIPEKKQVPFSIQRIYASICKALRAVDPQTMEQPCGRDPWPILGGVEGYPT